MKFRMAFSSSFWVFQIITTIALLVFGTDLQLPLSMPLNVVGETKIEILRHLRHDLTLTYNNGELSSVDSYLLYTMLQEVICLLGLLYGSGPCEYLQWYFCRIGFLYPSWQGGSKHSVLIKYYTRACQIWICSIETNLTYAKHLEFYQSYPFEELTKDASTENIDWTFLEYDVQHAHVWFRIKRSRCHTENKRIYLQFLL